MTLALENIKVLDFSRMAPGPFCTLLLGDMGADVLIIEEGGTPTGRRAKAGIPGITSDLPEAERRKRAAMDATRRNKRSIRINLKTEEGKELVYKLVKEADVVLEGYRPAVTKRLGIDYDTLSKINDQIVYCSISGFGQTGPYAPHVGHDINYISIGGALGMIGRPGQPPALPVNIVADMAGGGLMAAYSIAVALVARQHTGKGQYVDIGMSDGVFQLLASQVTQYFTDGTVPERGNSMVSGHLPNYDTYLTKDGKWFGIGALEPYFFANLCQVMGREDFIEHQGNADKWPEMRAHFTEQFKTKTSAEWHKLLTDVDVCAEPVLEMPELVTDPHTLARGMVIEVEAPDGSKVKQIGIGPKLSATPGKVRFTAPLAGDHTDEVLQSLGYDAAGIKKLREGDVVA